VKELLKQDDWNTIKASAIGNTYTVWLNGREVLKYTLQKARRTGPVGLQLHPGNEMSIQFKNIQLKEL
jgi:glycyl-tRNA synthetase alpha subunit